MMALITGMGDFDLLLFQVLRHDNCLDNLPWSCLDSFVMAPQAQDLDFFPLFNRKLSIDLTLLDVIGVRTVAELA